MSRWTLWTAAEDQLIEREYPCAGAIQIQELLPNRSLTAIRKRAQFLGVTRGLSAHDRDLIKSLADELNQATLAKKFCVHRHTIMKVTRAA